MQRITGGVTVLGLAVLVLSGCPHRQRAGVVEIEEPTATTGQAPADTTTGGTGETPAVEVSPNAWKAQIQDVFFDFDQAQLRSDARLQLQENARYLKEHPEARLTLEGHCDERGTNEYNLALGQRRADSVKAYLVDLGIPVTRLETISYGEERPFALGSNEAAWAQNRRVHFVIH